MVTSKPESLIIHVIDTLAIGGAERLLEVSLKLLPEYRHIVCYLSRPDSLASGLAAEKVYFLNLKSRTDLINCAFKLRRIIKKEKPQLVHSHLIKSTWISRIDIFFMFRHIIMIGYILRLSFYKTFTGREIIMPCKGHMAVINIIAFPIGSYCQVQVFIIF